METTPQDYDDGQAEEVNRPIEPNPTPEDIACCCEIIQEGWSAKERRRRYVVAHSFVTIIKGRYARFPRFTVPEVTPIAVRCFQEEVDVPDENMSVDHDYWGTS